MLKIVAEVLSAPRLWLQENFSDTLSDREKRVLSWVAVDAKIQGGALRDAYFEFFGDNADEDRWERHQAYLTEAAFGLSSTSNHLR